MMFVLSFIFAIAFLIIRRQFYMKKFGKLKHPPKLPILGNFIYLIDRESIVPKSVDHMKEYGKTYLIFAGLMPIVVTSDSKLLEIILSSTTLTKKSMEYYFLKRWWGDGLLVSSGEKWKSRRKILTPAFHYNILEDFVEVFETSGQILIENLDKQVGKQSFNIVDTLCLYTFDVICLTALGTKVDAQRNPFHKYLQAIREMCDIAITRMFNDVFQRFELLYKLTPLYKRELEVVSIITNFSMSMIKKRREVLKKIGYEFKQTDEFGKRRKATFVDILLCSKINDKLLEDDDIREEVDTFLFEGFDTTSAALSYIIYNLSKHQDVQRKVYDEVMSVLGEGKNKVANLEELQGLKYLEMVIKESLRLYPSVSGHSRETLEDIHYDGYVIPQGTTIAINQYALHRDEEVFPDPEKFDPERFELNNCTKRDPFAYIPFSAGVRNCIGQKFAMLELKSAIAKILKHFEILPAIPEHKLKLILNITLFSKNGVHVALRRREL